MIAMVDSLVFRSKVEAAIFEIVQSVVANVDSSVLISLVKASVL